MATLFLRGMGQRDVDTGAARDIKNQITNGLLKNEEWINFGTFSCKAGSITGITLESETQDKNGNKQVEEEYYADRMATLRLPVEVRAKRLGFWKFFYKVMRDKETTPELDAKAEQIQLEFFKLHPFRLEPDVRIFKELVGQGGAVNGRFFHLIESIINNDIHMSKYLLG
jgi:hypothetical protein